MTRDAGGDQPRTRMDGYDRMLIIGSTQLTFTKGTGDVSLSEL